MLRLSRRTTLWVVTGALLVGVGAITAHRVDERACGGRVETISDPADPLLSPALMKQRPEPHRDRLVRAAAALGPPFGAVLGGVDYYYEQWLHLYGVTGGVLAWTRGNAPVTFLSGHALRPVWGIRPATRRTAWDASADSFVLLSLSAKEDTQVQRFDLASGKERWCARLDTRNRDGDVLSTAVLPDASVVAATRSGARTSVTRLAGQDGDRIWRRRLSGVDRSDFVGLVDASVLVVGGREEFHLADGQFPVPHGPALTALHVRDGSVAWRYTPPAGATVHVVGVHDGRVLLLQRQRAGLRLLALDDQGNVAWSASPPDTALQATLRDGVVVLKAAQSLLGVDAATGRRRWAWPIPTNRTFIPYGFTLGQMPSLDAGHLLMPTTTDLRSLDVHTGFERVYKMPTDGINTTYWPYQLLATDQVIGIVTNTGAVVVGRG